MLLYRFPAAAVLDPGFCDFLGDILVRLSICVFLGDAVFLVETLLGLSFCGFFGDAVLERPAAVFVAIALTFAFDPEDRLFAP